MCALLGRARRARGCTTPGDDRIETRVYAVKRYLFRLGHAARSGRFATSVEQLVVGLAPVMGWGAVPRGGSERARFVRAHRKSVQRWLVIQYRPGLPDREVRALDRLVRNDPDRVVGFENQTGMTAPVAATAYLSPLTCPGVNAGSLRALRVFRDRRRGFGNAF